MPRGNPRMMQLYNWYRPGHIIRGITYGEWLQNEADRINAVPGRTAVVKTITKHLSGKIRSALFVDDVIGYFDERKKRNEQRQNSSESAEV